MNSIFQTPQWEQFKLSSGYQKSYRVDDILILQKQLPLGRSMLYSPMLQEDQISNLKSQITSDEFKSIVNKSRAIFYRAEYDIPLHEAESCKLIPESFIKAFEEMQPEHTIILDISKSEGEILAQMKPKGRYNIKVAEKNGVSVREDENIENFYALYSAMAQRQKITYRSKQYYQKLFDIMHAKGYVKVFTAYTKANNEEQNSKSTVGQPEGSPLGRSNTAKRESFPSVQSVNKNSVDHSYRTASADALPIASAIVSYFGERATYLFGGSSDEHRNLMGPYLVQWRAIQEGRKRQCREYDFFGTAPDDDPKHPWAGVTRYKKQFGGMQVELAGSWDLIFRPMEYQLFKIAEKIRR